MLVQTTLQGDLTSFRWANDRSTKFDMSLSLIALIHSALILIALIQCALI